MPLLLSQCLFAYIATHFFSVPSFSFLMNPLHPLFFTNLLSPHKTLPLPPSQFHLWKQSWFSFFFLVKNSCRALHCHYAVAAPLFFFYLFIFSKKISQKLSLPNRNFRLKLSRTLMRVQRLTECYGWSFNNGDKNSSDLNC